MDRAYVAEIFKGVVLSEEEITLISNHLSEVHFEKGALIVREGAFVSNKYFIREGCLRSFVMDGKGKEHTLQFAIKEWWISDYAAYFKGEKAAMNIECIQDSLLVKMTKRDRDFLFREVPQLETFFRVKFENTISSFQKRTLAALSYSAKEKYLHFIHTYPEIEQNVKNYHIASYLGITKESLSRVRKEIARKS